MGRFKESNTLPKMLTSKIPTVLHHICAVKVLDFLLTQKCSVTLEKCQKGTSSCSSNANPTGELTTVP